MPIYEYRCDDCTDRFDLLVRSSADADKAECPRCHGKKVARLLSTFAVGAAQPSSNGGGGMCQSVCAPAGRCMRNG